jgi:soluble lytic murein transglycosylase-like protein
LAQISPAATQSGLSVDIHVTRAAQRFGIPEHWIWAVMRVESAGRIRATSSAGAIGLMQLMPATWGLIRDRYDLGTDPYDVKDNIMAGAAYLREMHDRYGQTGMLAAYNAGPGRYEDYLLRGRPLPSETIAYIAKLMPMIGGSAAVPSASPLPATRTRWTRAALFARQFETQDSSTEGKIDVAVQPQIGATSAAPSPPTRTLLNAPSTGLFVPLSGSQRP